MKKTISIILILSLLLCMSACTFTGSNTKITLGVTQGVSSSDPVKASSESERMVAFNCFEGLLRLDADGTIDLGGAIGYSVSKDGLSYTFNLNEEAVWYLSADVKKVLKKVSYSETITSEDYVFGFKRFINEYDSLDCIKGASEYTIEKDSSIGLKATDPYTLSISLEKADPDFLYKLATLPLFPCSEVIYDALGDNFCSSAEYTVCNGPYFLKKSSQSETTLERNPDYSGGIQVTNRYISLYTTGSDETARNRFDNGTYDIYFASATTRLPEKTPTFSGIDTVWGFAFNMESDIGKSDALRKILLSSIYYGNISVPDFCKARTNRIIPENYLINDTKYSEYSPADVIYQYDLDAAKETLATLTADIGYTTYTVDFAMPENMKDSALQIISVWEDSFGDTFKFNLITFSVNEAELFAREGNYDLAFLPLSPKRHTALGMLESLMDAPCRYENLSLVAYDTLPSSEEIAYNCAELEETIISKGIFVPYCIAGSSIYSTEGTQGIFSVNGGEILYFHNGVKAEKNDK